MNCLICKKPFISPLNIWQKNTKWKPLWFTSNSFLLRSYPTCRRSDLVILQKQIKVRDITTWCLKRYLTVSVETEVAALPNNIIWESSKLRKDTETKSQTSTNPGAKSYIIYQGKNEAGFRSKLPPKVIQLPQICKKRRQMCIFLLKNG